MGDMLAGHPVRSSLPPNWPGRLELLLSLPVVFWAGAPFLQRMWSSFVRRRLNMFTLIGLGVLAAMGWSTAVVLAPSLIPESFKAHGELPRYFESAAVIVTLVLVGQVLELRARGRTGAALRLLLNLSPRTARRLEANGVEADIAPRRGCRLGISFGCVQASAFQWTAWCSRGRAVSTSP